MSNDYTALTATTEPSLGVRVTSKILAPEWTAMEAEVWKAMRDRVGAIPWLPAKWLQEVTRIHDENPDARMMISPSKMQNGSKRPGMPAWLDTQEKIDAWQEAHDKINKAINAYSLGQLEIGRELMAEAQSHAWWSDTIYSVVKVVADAPATIIGAAGDFATGIVGTFLRSFAPVLIVGAVVAIIWYNKESIGKAAGSRISGAIKG